MTLHLKCDCPVCATANYFHVEFHKTIQLSCVDCGFPFSGKGVLISELPNQCIICGSEHLYNTSLFALPFLTKSTVCYVCKTKYLRCRFPTAELRYSSKTDFFSLNSDIGKAWMEKANTAIKRAEINRGNQNN